MPGKFRFLKTRSESLLARMAALFEYDSITAAGFSVEANYAYGDVAPTKAGALDGDGASHPDQAQALDLAS